MPEKYYDLPNPFVICLMLEGMDYT